jgi:hypothetical protein
MALAVFSGNADGAMCRPQFVEPVNGTTARRVVLISKTGNE